MILQRGINKRIDHETTQQEINYPAIMEVLAELNYQGYVGQEFFPSQPTREFALESLRRAVELCDV